MFPNVRERSKKGEYVGRTIENMILTGTQESSRTENRPSTSSDQTEAAAIEDTKGKAVESAILTGTQESSDHSSPANRKKAKQIVIDRQRNLRSVAFLADGKHVVGGGMQRKIRCWRVEDGQQVGKPMDAGDPVRNVAVSQDGKWVVSGTNIGLVAVWNAENHSKETEWKAHKDWVHAVDVSPDGTRVATGSDDGTLCVWYLSKPSTGSRLVLGPVKHDNTVIAVKFSPNGCLVATATWKRDSVRVYDSQNGHLLFQVPVNSTSNQSLAWASDSKQLFALSRDGNVHCLVVSAETTLSKWAIHSSDNPRCIALASNSRFIVASANSSVSFWDTATHEQIGSVIEHTHDIGSMAISTDYHLATAAGDRITVLNLCDVLPSPYFNDVSPLVSKARCTSWLPNHNPLFLLLATAAP